MNASAGPGRGVTLLVVALLCIIWGSTWLVIRGGLTDLPPFSAVAIRFLIAGCLLSLVAGPLARLEGGARPGPSLVAVMGLLNIATSYALVYWSETVLPSGLVSLLWAVFPLMIALVQRVMLPEVRLQRRQWLGLVVGFSGMVVLYATDVRALGPRALPAALLLLLSPAASAFGNLWVKKHGAGVSAVLLNQRGMLLAGLALSALALCTEDVGALRLTPTAVGSVLYLSLFGSVVALCLYFWLLRYAPAHQLALISYVVPLIALSLGAAFADEPVGAHTLLGGALVLIGVGLVAGRRRRVDPKTAGSAGEPAAGAR